MVDVLGGEQQSRMYLNTHPAFLMGILRISDYLQFKQDRTPKILFKIRGKGMCSLISIREWKKHLSILNSHQEYSDNELLFVETHPNDAQTLEDIKSLFKEFQSELDSFWAVNGEIYSRYPSLSSLGINIRRIKSNIDNPQEYIRQNHKNFYPEVLSIKSDNQKVLPLLVSPLYGDEPSIGLRELIQNSIDACNERYSIDIHKEVNKENIPYKIDIIINMDDATLTIKDDGIGMDIDTIKDYFLKIGASYRYSEVWKSMHSDDDNIYVPRTGKFGIGMLAGFLIGDEISIVSKKEGNQSDQAITFKYNLNEKNIQVNFTNIIESGTTIIIESNLEKLEKLLSGFKNQHDYYMYGYSSESFWYYLDTPIVNILSIQDGEKTVYNNNNLITKEDIFSNWNAVDDTELKGFYWRIGLRYNPKSYVYCNGIIIRGLEVPSISILCGIGHIKISIKDICIFDNYGMFPLNLTRNSLVTKQFFELEKLTMSVIDYFFKIIKELINEFSWTSDNILFIIKNYFSISSSDYLPFVLFKDRILPLGDNALAEQYILYDFILTSQNRGLIYEKKLFSFFDDIGYCCIDETVKESHITKHIISNFLFNNKSSDNGRYQHQLIEKDEIKTNLNSEGWLFIKTFDFNKLDDIDIKILEANNFKIQNINKDWKVISKEEDSNNIPELGIQIINNISKKPFIFAIIKFTKSQSTEFSKLWEENINS